MKSASLAQYLHFLHGTYLSNVVYVKGELMMISSREQVTQLIVSAKVAKGIKWAEVAEAVGLYKEWVTAAC